MSNYLFPPSSNAPGSPAKRQRIKYAAISGFVTGTICAIASSFVNVWLYPDLPLHVSWQAVFGLWLLWAVAGCVLAGVAAISSEGWVSILLAAFLMATTALVVNFVQGINNLFLNILVLLGLSLPFTALLTPVAYIFFWLARRYLETHGLTGWERWRVWMVNAFVIIVLGLLPGLYSKFNVRTEQAVYLVHDLLQEGARNVPASLAKTEGFPQHQDEPYTLSQAPSVYSTVGVDVTAHYEDGYAILCTVILYPGEDARISPCRGRLP